MTIVWVELLHFKSGAAEKIRAGYENQYDFSCTRGYFELTEIYLKFLTDQNISLSYISIIVNIYGTILVLLSKNNVCTVEIGFKDD